MSIIKLAESYRDPRIIVVHPPYGDNGKAPIKGMASAVVGGTASFGINEAIPHIKGFSRDKLLHRYGKKLGSGVGGFIAAAATYKALNKKNNNPSFYVV
jgi:hypothetical protein